MSGNLPPKKSFEELLKELGVDPLKGLTSEEVKIRQKKFGFNEVVEKKESSLKRLAKKFWGLTSWMLEITMVLTLILGRYLDFYIVTGLLLLNVLLGYFQEERANKALEALKQKLHVNSRVYRDGKWTVIPARELVPGDIVRIRAGDIVPADIVIGEGEVEVDQSALTGESLTVSRGSNEAVYSGSVIRRGEATGIVTATGAKTYFGKTTELVNIARPKLHMEEVIGQVVKWLLIMVITLLAAAFVYSAILIKAGYLSLLELSLVLLVSAIPVALPAMFTITMALGSIELSKKGVLVTRLSASEDAASMDTLCVDKTGTITLNKISVAEVVPVNSFSEDDVVIFGALASEEANQDPIDLAFIQEAKDKKVDLNKYKVLKFVPFDPKTRRTEATVQFDGKTVDVIKGAVNVVIQLCKLDEQTKKKVQETMDEMAEKGYRSLGVALRENNEAKLIGIVGLYDKPRPDSAHLISELKDLGVKVKMLTGDAKPIALQVAKQVGLGENAADIVEVKQMNDEERDEIIEKSDVFAEVYPEDKYMIVKSLQKKKHIVGMTGDGVNDAPALKQAEVGIAVSNATDVAKAAASVVLTQPGLINIVDLVKTGRMIYQRIVTWIFNKVVKTFQIVVFTVIALFLWNRFVVNAYDVLLLLFLIDFVTISISTDNVRYSKNPDKWNIDWLVKVSMLIGVASVIESLFFTYIGVKYFALLNNVNQLHTFGFELLMLSGMLTIFVVRERGHFWNSRPSNTLLISIITDIALAVAISTFGIPGITPIPLIDSLTLLALSVIFMLFVNDFVKIAVIKKIKQ
ncbi:MAG: plasma-membrane proton-efflux P-type ATPase [Thaumarchaeota archaeon]|nr:plasma-membrane proton-efflux P-type ATPase [Nitrososphaerota archaeon]